MEEKPNIICKATKEILGKEKKLDINPLLEGYSVWSTAEALIKRGIALIDEDKVSKARQSLKRGLLLYNEGRQIVDKEFLVILDILEKQKEDK